MIKCTLHFVVAIIGTFLITTSITSFYNILSLEFLASNVMGVVILIIGLVLSSFSVRVVFKSSLLAFQWLGGILVWLICNSLIWHKTGMFIAMASAAITVYAISKYRHKINEKNSPDRQERGG